MSGLTIAAPVKGWAASLDEVPDPVFSGRMLGDGVAIDPLGTTVYAPCDGTIAAIHPGGHAVTVRSPEGAELLVHIGIDTVQLAGKGFRAHVAEGEAVACGQLLVDFDLDAIARAAPAVITPVILASPERFRIVARVVDRLVEPGDPLMTIEAVAGGVGAADGGEVRRRTVIVRLSHGIHARPAARIGACARGFQASVTLEAGERRAEAVSAVALMRLGLRLGDSVTVEARGPDAVAAAEAVAALIESGMGEAKGAATPTPAPERRTAPEGAIAGVAAAPGLAIGTAVWLESEVRDVAPDASDPEAERAAFDAARATVSARLEEAARAGGDAQRQILAAHLAFLADPELLGAARDQIAAGRSAGFAWRHAIAAQTGPLRASGDARMAERADDLDDLDRQLQRALAGGDPAGRQFAPDSILLAEELLPSQLIGLDPASVRGIALVRGGATSHAAILAAAAGLPMLVAMGPALADVAEGTALALDGDAGLLHLAPEGAALESHRARLAQAIERKAAAAAAGHEPCRTADGARIEVFANLASAADARTAVANGAEGSGLLRTEFLFEGRDSAPDEAEQRADYQAIADAMGERPVIVRLLDIGGDKPAPWLQLAPEKNPMLGVRGVRVLLARPDLLETQLCAILGVGAAGEWSVMVPMVTGLDELRAVRAAAARIAPRQVRLGVMIETPAAAATADLIAAEADFLSIGTNDLTQYVLAMDRENAALAAGVDALHPAVLRLIAQACAGGARHGRTVGVCGGLASDPLGIPMLIGLGVTELSVAPAFVPEAKALVRRLELGRCRALAEQALGLGSAADIRALARAHVEELG